MIWILIAAFRGASSTSGEQASGKPWVSKTLGLVGLVMFHLFQVSLLKTSKVSEIDFCDSVQFKVLHRAMFETCFILVQKP